jgi:HK97 gp10 family phage protein
MPNSALKMSINSDRLKRKFQALREDVRGDVLVNALLAGGLVVLDAARMNILAQELVRTRTLSRSLSQDVIEKASTRARIAIGTDLVYAAIHEFGGIITPKTAKYLAIPVNGATGSPRDRDDLKLRKSARGNLVLVDESGVQFVLKESVYIPAQPFLRPAVDENVDKIVEEVSAVLAQQIEATWKTN